VACEKCRQNVVWPDSLTAQDKATFAGECRSRGLEGAKLAVSRFGMDLREAKALLLHVTREPGKCHRCGTSVIAEISVCTNCRSANLDW
jgi:hypothetical protein